MMGFCPMRRKNVFDGDPRYITFGSVGNIPHWISFSSSHNTTQTLYTSFAMSFPFGNWPHGKFVIRGLSEHCKAYFSLSNGLKRITRLDSREHKEGHIGGEYPTPEQVQVR